MPRCVICGEKMIPLHIDGKDVYQHDHGSRDRKSEPRQPSEKHFPDECPHCGTDIPDDMKDASFSIECLVCENYVYVGDE